jgi:TolB-like protein/Flp pilus assembly protein TadD
MKSLLAELRKRNVFRVASVYLIATWIIIQVVDVMMAALELPDWVDGFIVLLLIVGFVIALVFAWMFELGPEGIRRTERAAGDASPPATGAKDYVLIAALLAVLGISIYQGTREAAPEADATVQAAPAAEPAALPAVPVENVAAATTRPVLRNSVAVLPFANLSPDPDNAYFASGIHEELLNQLAKIRDLNVIARTSVLQYADGLTPITEIAQKLNVETVMEGTVRYAGGSVRVTTQLIDAVTEAHLWSETYTRPFQNIFEIETDIAMQIATALEAEFSLAEQENVGVQLTNSPEAFALYVRAVELWQSTGPTPAILAAVNEGLDRAIAFDPKFAAAYAIKADLAAEQLFTDVGTPENWLDERVTISNRAEEFAATAIRLDPTYGYAYAALGKVHVQNWREAAAEEAFNRAVELSPNDPETLIEFAWFNSFMGRHEQAIQAAERVLDLDPDNADLRSRVGSVYGMAQDHDRALAIYREGMALDPSHSFNALLAATSAPRRGNYAEAVRVLRMAEELFGSVNSGWSLGQLAYGYGLAQSDADAQRVFDRITQLATEHRVGAVSWALASLGIGDQEQALKWLNAAAADHAPDEGSFIRGLLKRNFAADPVLEQPEFVEVRRRLGFGE